MVWVPAETRQKKSRPWQLQFRRHSRAPAAGSLFQLGKPIMHGQAAVIGAGRDSRDRRGIIRRQDAQPYSGRMWLPTSRLDLLLVRSSSPRCRLSQIVCWARARAAPAARRRYFCPASGKSAAVSLWRDSGDTPQRKM